MIVVDANILIRTVLGRRVRQLLEEYSVHRVRFLTPDVAFDDAEKYLPPLLKKRGKSTSEVAASIEYLKNIVEAVEHDVYVVREPDARHV